MVCICSRGFQHNALVQEFTFTRVRSPSYSSLPIATASFSRGPIWNEKRLNPYFIEFIGNAMVEIPCPHCHKDIELEDDAFGLFDCPHCDEEFIWEDDEGVSNEHIANPAVISGVKIGIGIVGIVLLLSVIFYIWIVSAMGCMTSCS